MRHYLRLWGTGALILAPATLAALVPVWLNLLEPHFLTDGMRPLWWRVTSMAVSLVAIILIPLWALSNAKQALRSLEKKKKSDADPFGYEVAIRGALKPLNQPPEPTRSARDSS